MHSDYTLLVHQVAEYDQSVHTGDLVGHFLHLPIHKWWTALHRIWQQNFRVHIYSRNSQSNGITETTAKTEKEYKRCNDV